MPDRVYTINNDSRGGLALALPLNLIALIIAYLDQPSDLASICRTCRVFYYMTLPSLYSNVSLRSYDHIRRSPIDGRPEGCGMGSPFSMGLNGLVLRNVSAYAKKFRVYGEWKDYELQEYSSIGRVTEGSMMLNTMVRVAIEKMSSLDSFSWELDTKMLPTMWQGLATKSTLTDLTVRFPSQRHGRPVVLVPPMPNLKSLKLYDIDPLCYADDVSLLLMEAKKLEELKLIWSPRMRDAREPSISLDSFFSKLVAAPYTLPIKRIAIKNLYTISNTLCSNVFDCTTMEEVAFINSVGGSGEDTISAFLDNSWRLSKVDHMPNIKIIRVDKVARQQLDYIREIKALEKVYLIGPKKPLEGQGSESGILPNSPPSTSMNSPIHDCSMQSLKDEYLETLAKYHGKSLRHLLLMPQWRLSADDIASIVSQCPNLEQLGLGVEFANLSSLRLLIPFLENLTALRLLDNPEDRSFAEKMRIIKQEVCHEMMGNEMLGKLQWIEVAGMLFEVGNRELQHGGPATDGNEVWRSQVWKRPLGVADQVEIFGLDSYEV